LARGNARPGARGARRVTVLASEPPMPIPVSLLAYLSLVLLSAAEEPVPAEKTKTLHSLKCRYTLPSGWKWQEPKDEDTLVAVNDEGLFLLIGSLPSPGVDVLDEKTALSLEKQALREGNYKKRSGRMLNFKGVQCYQLECTVPDGRPVAVRCF